jgi:hypothetical protein
MTREQMLAQAAELEAQADLCDAYRQEMERQTVRTAGRLGRKAAPLTYAAYKRAAADQRRRAAELRARAANLDG